MATESAIRWNNPRPFTPPGHRPKKVTGAQWDEINTRLANGETVQALALEYGVTASYIRHRASNA
ncbi:helix-turn-helix domain-containing protein [Streptomyces sp. NPDC056069]|uniref:helix-turn-helix domain-containing protein n=1 Tax=Streptomyces sp. NPDC056069 TaxID=3345702 RepID=UPI0035D989F4